MTTPTAPRRRARVSPVPPQHGAWAFLGLPVATALPVSPASAVLVLLAVTWVAAYPASYFTLALVRDRTSRHPDPHRFTGPLLTWGSVVLVGGLALLALRPWLVWVAAAYALSFVVNVAFARRRDDRALANDLVFIAQCTAMVPVTWAVAAGERTLTPPGLAQAPAHLWVLTVCVALVLVGSTLHVRSLIRERGNPRFRSAARAVAVASLVASFALAAWWGLPSGLVLVVPFAWFAARSVLMRGPAPRPGRIGIIELVGFVSLVVAAALAQAWGAS